MTVFIRFGLKIHFEQFPALQVLEFSHMHLDNIKELKQLAELMHLHTLFVLDCHNTTHLFRVLELTNPSTLVLQDIHFCDVNYVGTFSFPTEPFPHNLTHLDICNSCLDNQQFAFLIQGACKLKTLVAFDCKLHFDELLWKDVHLTCFIGFCYSATKPFHCIMPELKDLNEKLYLRKTELGVEKRLIRSYDKAKHTISWDTGELQFMLPPKVNNKQRGQKRPREDNHYPLSLLRS